MWFDINFLAVLVAALVGFALGHLWYSPVLFGKQWMAETGIIPDPAKMKAEMPKMLGTGFLMSFLSAYALAVLMSLSGIASPADGIKLAVVVWLGFMAVVHYQGVLYGGASRRLFLIQSGYDLAALAVMGLILSVWR